MLNQAQGSVSSKPLNRIALLIIFLGILLTSVSFLTVYKAEKIQNSNKVMRSAYVPLLKNIKSLSGKWLAYQKVFDGWVRFKEWGKKDFEVQTKNRISLKRLFSVDLSEIEKTIYRNENLGDLNRVLNEIVSKFRFMSEQESLVVAEISSYISQKDYKRAADVFSQVRRNQQEIGSLLEQVVHKIETAQGVLQDEIDSELRDAQLRTLLIAGLCLTFSFLVIFLLRRWLMPLRDWSMVAKQIAINGVQSNLRFPKINSFMLPEMETLARELIRMSRTILEREQTITLQNEKFENLNSQLIEQNEYLVRLGSLNEGVIQEMSSGILVIRNELIEQYNPKVCEILGVSKNNLLNSKVSDVLKSFGQELVKKWLSVPSVIIEKKIGYSFDSHKKVLNVHVAPLSSIPGGRLLFFDDVTKEVEIEERLNHLNKLVLASNMSAQVAHEVRNPLNAMSLQLELLQEDIEASVGSSQLIDQLKKRIKFLADQFLRLERITSKYLNLSNDSIQANGNAVKISTKVDLRVVVENALEVLSQEIQANQIKVFIDDEFKPVFVDCDQDSIHQVVLNLLKNSIDALTGSKSPKEIQIKILCTDLKSNRKVSLQIKDNGSGVDSSLGEKIFDPFFTTKSFGNGLGLSVSRQISIAHGGELKLISQKNGACFELQLPRLSL